MSDEQDKSEKAVNPQTRRLTVKEQKFVQALVSGNSPNATQAVKDAGYRASTNIVAKQMAYEMMQKPHIQNAITVGIQERFPDIAGVGAELLYGCMTDPDARWEVKLKALDMLISLFGWRAPTKVVTASFKGAIPDLPTGDE